MICPNCKQPTSRLRVYRDFSACAACLGLSESGGVKIDGSLTRQSTRIRDQQRTHEGDIIPPHVFDYNKRGLVPNPDFIKRYPEKLTSSYTVAELKAAGHSRIAPVFKAAKEQKKAHDRNQAAGITYRRTPKSS